MIQGSGKLNIGELVLHHTADAWTLDFEPLGVIRLPRWPDIHVAGMTLNLSPTKHVVFLALAASLAFIFLWLGARSLDRQRRLGKAPTGIGNVVEAMVLYVRSEIAIANIGHGGARYAPFILTLFFLVLVANLIGLLPWGSSATGNLAVTAALALMVFIAIEVGGLVKLGPKGYLRTIFPQVPGLTGAGGAAMSVGMAPIEIIGKLVKPFALAVRLFGNITAGHFVVLSLFGIIFLFGQVYIWNVGIGLVTAVLVTGIMMLELIVALLQAYVFALLSAVFIGLMQHEH